MAANATSFTKGDKRINRKGRPRNFDALRELAKQIGSEIVISKDGLTKMSMVELILRSWSSSNNHQLQRAFIEIAYGKVPDVHEITGKDGEPITITTIEVVRDGE